MTAILARLPVSRATDLIRHDAVVDFRTSMVKSLTMNCGRVRDRKSAGRAARGGRRRLCSTRSPGAWFSRGIISSRRMMPSPRPRIDDDIAIFESLDGAVE